MSCMANTTTVFKVKSLQFFGSGKQFWMMRNIFRDLAHCGSVQRQIEPFHKVKGVSGAFNYQEPHKDLYSHVI